MSKVDPCTEDSEWKCRFAFDLLDRLPTNEVPLHCQTFLRLPGGDPRCRRLSSGLKRCTIVGTLIFLQRYLGPKKWEPCNMDTTETLAYCVSTVGRPGNDPSQSIDVEEYFSPATPENPSTPVQVRTDGEFTQVKIYMKTPNASPKNPFL
ncbi:unnamed protein product [Bemisia tabaci]|uniref:Uncharacterized protein n=1 Tax=Bemisia tabaci TaxID=7038 RepID=A0A9P0G2T0_BEMTA|nr:unnamed protein product [Bemisia tabaci]